MNFLTSELEILLFLNLYRLVARAQVEKLTYEEDTNVTVCFLC